MATGHMDKVCDLAGNRRYCFVIMPYKSLDLFYEHLRQVIQAATGLRCIRADEVPGSGQPLLEKVHALIENAELVVVELSEPSPNVYYETGYARALGKAILVVCREGTLIPTDLQGLERIQYANTNRETLTLFDHNLRCHLVMLVDSNVRLLRAMLEGPESSPSFIVCSPRWNPPESVSDIAREMRTYGDYLGVVGVIFSLGILLGKDGIPELVSARQGARELLERDANFYLIGSPRANEFVASAMSSLQRSVDNPWRFVLNEEKGTSTLAGWRKGGIWEWEVCHSTPVPREDYGIVLRGPKPNHPKKQVLIMAGTRSYGTGAACLAATRPQLIQSIRNTLHDIELEDRSRTIWALVRCTPDPKDNHVSPEFTEVVDAGIIR